MLLWFFRLFSTLLVFVTLLPLARTGFWFVRGWDMPRMQIAVLAALGLVVATAGLFFRFLPTGNELWIWITALVGVFLWQSAHTLPFTPLWPVEVKSADAESRKLRMMIVNLDYQNDEYSRVADEIRQIAPDVLHLIEIDEGWRAGLSVLRDSYQYHHEEVRGEGLGMAVWSRIPLKSATTKFVVEDRRPSIWTTFAHQGELINVVTVHPTPPGLMDSTGDERRDSRVRDAELISIAKTIADSNDQEWIVCGDFNDVAWSHTTRLFKRLSGLNDPRVGRSFMGTFHSGSPLLRVPIDHIFVSDGFQVASLSRHQTSGSDHFAVISELCLAANKGVEPEPEYDDRQEAERLIEEGVRDAERRGVLAEPQASLGAPAASVQGCS